MKVAVLFPKIFDHPFTYKSEISENLKPGDFINGQCVITEDQTTIVVSNNFNTKVLSNNFLQMEHINNE